MLLYLLCDACRAPSTRIIWPGYPGKEQALCDRCYLNTIKPIAGGEDPPAPTTH
jgi:hypothetical protein